MFNRKKFMINNKPVSAGGILFYTYFQGTYDILVQEENGLIGDFGGKVEWSDPSILYTSYRELCEEFEFTFTLHSFYDSIYNNLEFDTIYIRQAKYMLHFAPFPFNTDLRIDYNNKPRNIFWIPLTKYLQTKKRCIHRRLRHGSVKRYLINLQKIK